MSPTKLLLASVAAISATAVADPNPAKPAKAAKAAKPKARKLVLSFAPQTDPKPDDAKPTDTPTDDTTTDTATPPPPTTDAATTDTAKADDTKAKDTKTDDQVTQAKEVAALDPPRDDLHADTLFAPKKLPEQQLPTPRFELSAGGFLQERGMNFIYAPITDEAPPDYPASNVKGFALSGAVYPFPLKPNDNKLSGIGFSFKVAKSVGSTIVASDDTGVGEYVVDHTAYEAGLHYRYPIDKFAIDGELSYGSWGHVIADLPESIAIPDTTYTYLAAGLHLDIYPTERASIGVGGKWLDVTSAGDIVSQDWYGAGQAGGVVLDANVSIPLPGNLFVRGGVEWRKMWIEFDGSGDLSYQWAVGGVEDTSVTGTAQLGVQF